MYKGSRDLNDSIQGLYNFCDHPNHSPNHPITPTPDDLPHDLASLGDPVYDTDEFRMYCYKIKRCPRTSSHDWIECPFAHRGEKATRRDPRRFTYAAVSCPAYKHGRCPRGTSCHLAHGIFEYWLHPTCYRTRACNSGRLCQRKVCFFAHTQEELRSEDQHSWLPRARVGAGEDTTSGLGQGTYVGSRWRGFVGSPVRVDGGTNVEADSEIMDSLKRLKIREEGGRGHGGVDYSGTIGNGLRKSMISVNVGAGRNYMGNDVSCLPNIDWISDLVDEDQRTN